MPYQLLYILGGCLLLSWFLVFDTDRPFREKLMMVAFVLFVVAFYCLLQGPNRDQVVLDIKTAIYKFTH